MTFKLWYTYIFLSDKSIPFSFSIFCAIYIFLKNFLNLMGVR